MDNEGARPDRIATHASNTSDFCITSPRNKSTNQLI
jgi:hypothetical protein